MSNLIGKSSIQNLVFSLCIWGLLVISFVTSLKYGFFKKEWNEIIYFLQLGADGCITVFGYLSYKKRAKDSAKIFYFLIFLSLIPGLFANEIYNILINILQITRGKNESLYWSVAYTFFLSIQIYAWFYLFQRKVKQNKNHIWLTTYPYFISAGIIFLSLILILFVNDVYAQVNFNGILNSLLEIILFSLISINLSRAKNKSLICLEVGFLLLIGFNFAHRFSDVLSIYYKIFDMAWMLCLVVIIYGLYFSFKEARKEAHFFEENSIHVLTSGAFVLFTDLILMAFIFGVIGFSAFQIDKIPNLKILMLDVPSAFIFSYSVALLLSKFFTWHLSLPFDQMAHKISGITKNQKNRSYGNQFKINEIEVFEEFIIKTISDLHHANDVKSKFLMNMSHDFRTPASGILYMSRLIHDRLLDDKTKRLQKMVVNSSEQLMTFLDDILDYSRLEHSKVILRNTSFNIIALINELINFVSVKVYEKNLIINAAYAQDETICYSDKSFVRRIILNLLSNAIKFTNIGEINIFTSFFTLNNKEHILISIRDAGIGIDKTNHQKIFEPFYSVEGADSSKYPGIGLGLSNVDLMVKELNGQVTLKSELGLGSEFSVYLPLQ
ncbi:MAG: HAMP domain-containing sensor histidine kinase [Gammaproteobacteria bacterium]